MNESLVQIDALSTGYGRGQRQRVVSAGLSAGLRRGALTCLIGVNGTGKSTLLRTMCGLQPPLSGRVLWEGAPLSAFSPRQLARKISVVLTSRPDTGALTVREAVETGRLPYTPFSGRLSEEDRRIVQESMAVAGVAVPGNRELAALSDGERQRVMVAKALAQQTPAIFLDEPAAFLDFPAKIRLFRLLAELARRHAKTILLTTHDIETALLMADRLWLLSPSGLREGAPRALARDGSIGRLLHGSGVAFDPETLRFRVAEEAALPERGSE